MAARESGYGGLRDDRAADPYRARGRAHRGPKDDGCLSGLSPRMRVCVPAAAVLTLVGVMVTVLVVALNSKLPAAVGTCDNGVFHIVESIPAGMNLTTNMSTYEGWLMLLDSAKETVEIAAFYDTLTEGKLYGMNEGPAVFDKIIEVAKRGVAVTIVENADGAGGSGTGNDTKYLVDNGFATAHYLNMSWFMDKNAGVLHTKFIIVDRRAFYVGSANFDWRSLQQVKELGIVVDECTLMANSLGKVFDMYTTLSEQNDAQNYAELGHWPDEFVSPISMTTPATVTFNRTKPSDAFIAVSPPPFCPPGRTSELEAILSMIHNATEAISISVMDYSPSALYVWPPEYWPVIDDALREAAFNRRVNVRLMISRWNHTKTTAYMFGKSLNDLTYMSVRVYTVPPYTTNIPFTRVNHAKYMVADNTTLITTSNWSRDYMLNTAGVSFVTTNEGVRSDVQAVFDRDWYSEYTMSVSDPNIYNPVPYG